MDANEQTANPRFDPLKLNYALRVVAGVEPPQTWRRTFSPRPHIDTQADARIESYPEWMQQEDKLEACTYVSQMIALALNMSGANPGSQNATHRTEGAPTPRPD